MSQLDGLPNAAALYPKVVLGGLRRSGGELSDELPITYPHILAFGLQMSLIHLHPLTAKVAFTTWRTTDGHDHRIVS